MTVIAPSTTDAAETGAPVAVERSISSGRAARISGNDAVAAAPERDERGAERVGARLGVAHDVPGVGERQQDRVARGLAHVAGAGEVREAQPRAFVGTERLEDPHDALGGVRALTRHLFEY